MHRPQAPRRPRCGPAFLALAAGLTLSLSACTTVKEGLDKANQSIKGALGSDSSGSQAAAAQPVTNQQADGAYQAGLAAQRAGDQRAALARFREAADLGHGPAAYEVGIAYTLGRGTAKDLDQAAQWLNIAVDRGEPRAQYIAGVNRLTGTGVSQDLEQANAYFAAAALQDHPRAQFELAESFANGRGVNQDLAWAARWYGKSARQGLPEAQFAYGVFQATGRGLPKNKILGYSWITLAARGGHAEAERVRSAMARQLTPAQRAVADNRAAAFRAGPTPRLADKPTVAYLQYRLNGMGYQAGPVDGVMGPRTRNAIASFQGKHGMASDGTISSDLLSQVLAESRLRNLTS